MLNLDFSQIVSLLIVFLISTLKSTILKVIIKARVNDGRSVNVKVGSRKQMPFVNGQIFANVEM